MSMARSFGSSAIRPSALWKRVIFPPPRENQYRLGCCTTSESDDPDETRTPLELGRDRVPGAWILLTLLVLPMLGDHPFSRTSRETTYVPHLDRSGNAVLLPSVLHCTSGAFHY